LRKTVGSVSRSLTILQVSKPDNIPLPYTSALPYPASMLLSVALFQGFRGRFVFFDHLCEHLFNPLFRQPRPLAKRLD
jgi:hypothetical protein